MFGGNFSPDFARNMFVPYSEVFGDTFCRGLVVKVNTEKKRITLDDKSKVSSPFIDRGL